MTPEELPWYVLYTKPRNEKKVAQRLSEAGYNGLLPFAKSSSPVERPYQGGGRAAVQIVSLYSDRRPS
jgi:hypothetical protein